MLDLSGITDLSIVTEVSGCGITVTFSIPMNKRTVPGGGWATWGSPPDTEGNTPEVLWTDGGLKVTLRFTVRSRIVGVEAEPNAGLRNITATMRRLNGTKIGKIVREVDSNAGALLFAGKVKSTKQSDRVKEITLKSDGDFAIGRIRVS